MKTYRIIFKSGQSVSVQAESFEVDTSDHVIQFRDEQNGEDKDIYLPTFDVLCVIPEKSSEESEKQP